MKLSKAIKYYLIGTILQIGIVCGILAVLRIFKINYSNITGFTFTVIGGLSSAIWGIIISKRSGRVHSYLQILKDFFNIRQFLRYYILLVLFLLIIFGKQLFTGEILESARWYTFFLLFLKAIMFGGIEEIGWRYTLQPMLEEYLPFEAASLITFVSWGVWHYMYFYIVGAISDISHVSFLIGLLCSSFILGVIFTLSKSLWLCVLYHSMLNVFSQTLKSATMIQTLITTIICIVLSILMVRKRVDYKHRTYK